MPQARNKLVCLDETPYYHCISRCVRRAYLCGIDSVSGRNLNHRRQWVTDRLRQLSQVFAVEVYAYAIMSNHFHLVVKIDHTTANQWTDDEVVNRWSKLFALPPIVKQYWAGEELSEPEYRLFRQLVTTWRTRLYSLSWFMRALNEPIARRANQEDECTGRFWEGRYKSQAILDRAALLAVMAYVDLNPVRAGAARSITSSTFTSIRERLLGRHQSFIKNRKQRTPTQKKFLQPINTNNPFLPISLAEYVDLLEWTAKHMMKKKSTRISSSKLDALDRAGIRVSAFTDYSCAGDGKFHSVIGHVQHIRQAAVSFGKKFLKGQRAAAKLFTRPSLHIMSTI